MKYPEVRALRDYLTQWLLDNEETEKELTEAERVIARATVAEWGTTLSSRRPSITVLDLEKDWRADVYFGDQDMGPSALSTGQRETVFTPNRDFPDGFTDKLIIYVWHKDTPLDENLKKVWESKSGTVTTYSPGGGGVVSTPKRFNGAPQYTCNPEAIDKALQYADAFWDQWEDFKPYVDNLYADFDLPREGFTTFDQWWHHQGYSGLTGVRLYHLMDEMAAVANMIQIFKVVKPERSEVIKAYAVRKIREFTQKIFARDGAASSTENGNIFVGGPGLYRYLNYTRGAAWLGLLMESVLNTPDGEQYRGEFASLARQLIQIHEPYLDRADEPQRVAHMAAMPGMAAHTLAEVAGTVDDVADSLARINNHIISLTFPWDLTDISHAEQTIHYYQWLYERNLRSAAGFGDVHKIDDKFMEALADEVAGRLGEHHYNSAPWTQMHGFLVRHSTRIERHIGSLANITPIPITDSFNPTYKFGTLTSAAYGYLVRKDAIDGECD